MNVCHRKNTYRQYGESQAPEPPQPVPACQAQGRSDSKLIEASKDPTPWTNYEIIERYGSLDVLTYADVLDHYRVRGGEPPSESEWLASRALDQKKDRT